RPPRCTLFPYTTLFRSWSGDRELLLRHRKTVVKCCQWILQRLKDGKGFIFYAPALLGIDDENRNQAWKDSGDAIVDADGRVCIRSEEHTSELQSPYDLV